MEMIETIVYSLEMLAPSNRIVAAPREGLSVVHLKSATVGFYRPLYNAVGKKYRWLSRRKMTDEQLAALLREPRNELHVLYVEGQPAGFAELDRIQPNEIELVQFGLTDEFMGQGIGKWFLQELIDTAWSYRPQRLWLHTCTLDHPAALPNYIKAGFVLYKQEVISREL